MNWWVSDVLTQPNGYVILFSWCFWVLLSICLHELGHGVAALWEGDDTPRALGHMNLNPMVHMGAMSLLVFAIVGIAWGAMPVNPSRFRHGRLGDVIVSFAGPAVNLILAFVLLTAFAVFERYFMGSPPTTFQTNFGLFLFFGGFLNVALFIWNLLPIYPADGSRILAGLSEQADAFFSREEVQRGSLFVLLLLLIFVGSYFWPAIEHLSNTYIDLVHRVLP